MTSWLLLLHNLPPTPPYLRAKVLRRLQQLGAVPVKKSAYLLPAGDETREQLHWLRRAIEAEGGSAWIVEGRLAGGLSDAEAQALFRAARAADYDALAGEARALLGRAGTDPSGDPAALRAEWRRLERRRQTIAAIDFFEAEGAGEVGTLMDAIDRTLTPAPAGPPTGGAAGLRARRWVTRAGVKVDRMASAWLIRRFIDPAATFLFVAEGTPPPADALRFDMFDGDFTHDAGRCTFEVLLAASDHAADPALVALGEVVHQLDLYDDRFDRPEAPGLARLLDGIVTAHADDHARLAASAPVFDALHAGLAPKP